jgi:hypothetical protein
VVTGVTIVPVSSPLRRFPMWSRSLSSSSSPTLPTYVSPFTYASPSAFPSIISASVPLTIVDRPRVVDFLHSLPDRVTYALLSDAGIDHDYFASRSVCRLHCQHDHADFAAAPLCSLSCGHSHSSYASSLLCRLTCGHTPSDFPSSYLDASKIFYSSPRTVSIGGTVYQLSLVDSWISFHFPGSDPRTAWRGFLYI